MGLRIDPFLGLNIAEITQEELDRIKREELEKKDNAAQALLKVPPKIIGPKGFFTKWFFSDPGAFWEVKTRSVFSSKAPAKDFKFSGPQLVTTIWSCDVFRCCLGAPNIASFNQILGLGGTLKLRQQFDYSLIDLEECTENNPQVYLEYGGFLKWGWPQLSSILDWDCPWNRPSSYWGTPHDYRNPFNNPKNITNHMLTIYINHY